VAPAGRAGMNERRPPSYYEIRIEGVLDNRWAAWFEGLEVTRESNNTIISGLLPDQPALHGVLTRVRDLGLSLVSVRRVHHEETRETGG
jgi:hypothetical protein